MSAPEGTAPAVPEAGRPAVGDRLELVAGPVAHGGHVVARVSEGGLVVFVRHALPGERVVVEVTEDDGRFLRGDAVEVLDASPDRVVPPCPYAGPGACGGCDSQHASLDAQRRLKGAVVSEQLARLAGIDREVVVEPVPVGGAGGVDDGQRWRSRMQYVALPDDQVGLRSHRSHDVVAVEDCLIQSPEAVVTVSTGLDRRAGSGGSGAAAPTVTETVTTYAGTRTFEVAADGFWQPHVEAPRLLVETVLELAALQPGERVLDLYAGVGLFAAYLGQEVGPEGSVVAIEGDGAASRLSRRNLADVPAAEVVTGRVDRALHHGVGAADVVVLDPPRVGAKRQVVRHLTALAPRAVVYVACDPAALARDVAYFAEQGYRLDALRAFDLFPMTQHVECVALLVPA
ncbi:Protein-L-isoaspartate(D-aspartate) O-methyltransferase (PCMT) [Nocardioides scoriae]|uniref:Protein-L-isoaspartate(D-aspartate) O-methyltransferase (PCMT) n=1 Tax=Nocardioides scoriae TaxID=642780 RepID=A0A1H1Q4E9_9ACTN|nr:TRAM domain-containing protein [Nocardioides scoriae]SDS18286.1 Protein-L-isoaspartate(D-aspartate) O-methyltransferase (PCMT) [Nocardioides scoriae]